MSELLAPAWDALFSPFIDYAFMRRALVATLALSLSAAPLGVFLTLRRMSLLGDALSHAILPGVAIGFMVAGLSLGAMALGGVLAGMLVAGISAAVSRFTTIKEDASLAAIYLVALALGVTLISANGTQLDLLHILFGSALGVDQDGLLLVAGVSTVSVLGMAWMYRALVLETFDPIFLNASRRTGWGGWSGLGHGGAWVWHQAFLMLVVVKLVAGFQTLGTLMAVGLMMLPAVSARLWHDTLPAQLMNASLQAALSGIAGLLLSYHFDTPSGPTIIGCAGALYGASLLLAPNGWLPRYLNTTHRVA
jgi:zinc/manganese transport system permease protein